MGWCRGAGSIGVVGGRGGVIAPFHKSLEYMRVLDKILYAVV